MTSIEEKSRILTAQVSIEERFSRLNRKISNNRHAEFTKFSEISEHCGYAEIRRNSSNVCYNVETPTAQICCTDNCPYIK